MAVREAAPRTGDTCPFDSLHPEACALCPPNVVSRHEHHTVAKSGGDAGRRIPRESRESYAANPRGDKRTGA